MKKLKRLSFIKTTVVGGLIFLVPIIVLIIIFGKALGITRTIVGPLITMIDTKTIGGVGVAIPLANIYYCIVRFFARILAKTISAKKIIGWGELRILTYTAGYTFMKSMGESFAGMDIN